MNLALAYARFRGSFAFVGVLALLMAAALLLHWLFGFDPDWGITNLSLSTEASISVALLIMDTAKQEALQRKQLQYMLTIMEALQVQLRTAVIGGTGHVGCACCCQANS